MALSFDICYTCFDRLNLVSRMFSGGPLNLEKLAIHFNTKNHPFYISFGGDFSANRWNPGTSPAKVASSFRHILLSMCLHVHRYLLFSLSDIRGDVDAGVGQPTMCVRPPHGGAHLVHVHQQVAVRGHAAADRPQLPALRRQQAAGQDAHAPRHQHW